jgi:hypothetical protein
MSCEEPIQIFKTFKEHKTGRPKTAILDSNGRNIKAIESRKRWASEHKEYVNQSVKEYIKKKNNHHDRCQIIVNVLKELIRQQKVSLPNELVQLVQTV